MLSRQFAISQRSCVYMLENLNANGDVEWE